MIEISYGTPENLVIATAHGKVTAEDYERTLIPAVEAKLKAHKKVRMLYHLDRDLSGFTAGAIWDDAKLGIHHLTAFEAVALVTDIHWVTDATNFFAFFIRCPVKVFKNDQLAEAMEWVSTVHWMTLKGD
ncbi:MAG TPA: STAS/SEC14 domain-containing protein [Chthoniobacteraceae bacterium]|jgi:hypothetical protein|nr:STAS/SEC14 domain-containing protein [Chthoniobacteraceae bacterium]